MAPNPKKRKAAKNRQKNQSKNTNNISSASTHSNDNVKRHDDKDRNVGEVSSLASQNRDQLRTLTEGKEKTIKNGESVVKTDQGVKIENKSIKMDGKIEHDELSTSSNNRASSSDDEPRHNKNNPAVEGYSAPVNPVEAIDLLSETPRVDEITLCVEEAEVNSFSEDKVGISDPKGCEVQEKDDRLTTSYGASNVRANDGAEGDKDSVTQPLLERPLQKTSWKSCCGLFDLFTRSAS